MTVDEVRIGDIPLDYARLLQPIDLIYIVDQKDVSSPGQINRLANPQLLQLLAVLLIAAPFLLSYIALHHKVIFDRKEICLPIRKGLHIIDG